MTRISTAMVMAAGLGSRMRPLTNDRPKPLVTVAGRPLIDHMLDRLADAGVGRAIVNVHYRADQLEAHLADRRRPAIVISDERALLLETGGGLAKARPLLGDDPIFVANTDSLWIERAPALGGLAAAWDPDRMDVLVMLAPLRHAIGFDGTGDFALDAAGRILVPVKGSAAPYAYTGVQILRPGLFDARPAAPFSTWVVWREVLSRGRMFGVVMDGVWLHVGDPAAREAAELRLAQA
jgi:MurNAc alpha-1-phosphate uridylyltransferase